MFHRVVYVAACICLGLIFGTGLGGRLRSYRPKVIGDAFYRAIAALVVVSPLATLGSNVGHTAWYWTWATGIAGGFANICFGAVWGITARQRSLAVVQQRAVTEALRMAVAFTFAIAAVGKALSFAAMTDFFTRSGYSISFLKFIMIAEALGAVGILIPWAFIPSLIGLTIDMCGAIGTHVRNGDPLNDSTGAISLLVKLATIGVLLAVAPAPRALNPILQHRAARLTTLCVVAGASIAIALGGAACLHR